MVKQFREYFSNPFVWAALICAVLIYSGAVVPFSRLEFNCLVQNPVYLCGRISSNPVKTSGGKYYTASISVVEAGSENPEIKSSCSGNVKALIPSSLVESLYPGRLYSSGKGKGVLIEKNEALLLHGKFSESGEIFIVSSVNETSLSNGSSFGNWFYRKRALYRLALKRLLYSWGDAGGLVLSLLSGSREYLDTDLSVGFKKAGLSHVLALSGMHLGFFFSLSTAFGVKLIGKKNSYLISVSVLLLFVSFVGFTPSLTRSFIFISLIILSKKVNSLSINHFELLCLVFLIHLVLLPGDVKEVSFMLSYGALSGILLLSPFLGRIFSRVFPKNCASSLAASTSAQVFTFPVSYLQFGEVMPIGIVSTMFVSPFISVFMSVSLFAIIICLAVPFLSGPFGCIMRLMYRAIYAIVGIFARVPSLTF